MPSASFESAKGKEITKIDVDAFIDSSITGNDRNLARYFMSLMPKGMRGDFIYIRPDRTMLSNRPILLKDVTIASIATALTQTGAMSKVRSVQGATPPQGGGGPYARQYSALGVDAATAYATFDCNDALLFNPVSQRYDVGYMYVGGFGMSGGAIDAGLQYNNDGSIQPFLSISGPGYTALKYGNPGIHYGCGEPIGLMYGGLPYGQPDPNQLAGNYMFYAAGRPDISPYDMQLPPAESSWTNSAWTFFNPPSDFVQSGTDATGAATPCRGCVSKRMISIGQTYVQFTNDNECIGACNGATSNRWDQTVMGELISPCQNYSSSATCTIQYQANNSWLGGYQVYPDSSAVQVNDPSPNNGAEGINLAYEGPGTAGYQRRIASSVTFNSSLPLAPSTACTPDSMNMCASSASNTVIDQCDTGTTNAKGVPIYIKVCRTVYDVFSYSQALKTLHYLSAATKTQSYDNSSGTCVISSSWSPSEPSVQYGDASLP